MSEPQNYFININGLRLHYLGWGNPDAPPMLLLHGLGANAYYWDFFAPTVYDRFHVIALDQRGHGNSDWADAYGPRHYVEDVEAFVEGMGLRDMIMVGHSLGGVNGILYAGRNPDRVSKIVIVDIGPEIGQAGIDRMMREMTSEPESFGSLDEVAERIRYLQPRYSDDFVEHQLTFAVKTDRSGRFVWKCDPSLRDMRIGSPEYLWEHLGDVICHTLIVRGEESDVLMPDTAQTMLNVLPFRSVRICRLCRSQRTGRQSERVW